MPVVLTCSCGKKLRVPDEQLGRRVRCSACGQVLTATAPGPPPAPPDRPAGTPITWEELGLPEPRPGSREAMASNPGRVRVHYLHHLRCYPTFSLALAAVTLLMVPAALFLHWAFWIAFVPLLLLNWRCWYVIKWQALYGDVNPGLVVATDPYLVAVRTDLSTGLGDPCPAVKIVRQPLGRMTGGPPPVGARLATVATYVSLGNRECWADFFPDVVNCFTADATVPDRVLATIDEDAWRELEEALRHVPQPYKPGLYKLDAEEEEEDEEPRPPLPRERLEELVAEHLPHQFVSGWYLAADGIPEKKLQNALAGYAKGVEAGQVLGLGDTALLSSGAEGVVLTTDEMIFSGQEHAGRVRWRDVASAEVVRGWPTFRTEVTRRRGKRLGFDCSGFDREFVRALEELLNEVGRLNDAE